VKCLYNSLRVAARSLFFFCFVFSAEALRALTERQTVGQQHCRRKYLKTYAKLFAVCHVNGFWAPDYRLFVFRFFFFFFFCFWFWPGFHPLFGQLICRLLKIMTQKPRLTIADLTQLFCPATKYFTQKATYFTFGFLQQVLINLPQLRSSNAPISCFPFISLISGKKKKKKKLKDGNVEQQMSERPGKIAS